jgi:hypothetical protein
MCSHAHAHTHIHARTHEHYATTVYKTADRVPVEAALDGSAEARRVLRSIAAASGGGVNENG